MRAGGWEKLSGSKAGTAASASCLILQKGRRGAGQCFQHFGSRERTQQPGMPPSSLCARKLKTIMGGAGVVLRGKASQNVSVHPPECEWVLLAYMRALPVLCCFPWEGKSAWDECGCGDCLVLVGLGWHSMGHCSSRAQSLRLLCTAPDRKLFPLSWQIWLSSPQLLPDS